MEIMNETLTAIFNRKSCRTFLNKPVSEDIQQLLLQAAMSAPTAVNRQPWAFVVVDQREILTQMANGLPYAKMLVQATLCIIVCGIPGQAFENKHEMWIQDCSAATENVLIAAESLGLGSVWTALYPYADRISVVRELLNIPEHVEPLSAIAIGYPASNEKPKDKFIPGNIHKNSW